MAIYLACGGKYGEEDSEKCKYKCESALPSLCSFNFQPAPRIMVVKGHRMRIVLHRNAAPCVALVA